MKKRCTMCGKQIKEDTPYVMKLYRRILSYEFYQIYDLCDSCVLKIKRLQK